jgi:FkbM family methyltransferase
MVLKLSSNGWVGGWSMEPVSHRRVCYSNFDTAWLADVGIAPTVVFDVGAFDGADSLRFQRAYPDATVVSVEGDPIRAQAIRNTIGGKGIILVEAVVLDRDGEADWYQGGDRSEFGSKNGSVFRWDKKPPRDPDRLKCRTLRSICRAHDIDHIDFLHIDVEGAELLVLRGLDPIKPRAIWAEVVDAWVAAPGARATHDAIIARGYRQISALGSDRFYLLES